MKKIILFLLCLILSVSLIIPEVSARGRGGGSVRVKGYTTKSGTYVAPHHRTSPDRSKSNNWSTKGNVNPYTGEGGTKEPY